MYAIDADYDDAALRRGLSLLVLRSRPARVMLGQHFTRLRGVYAQSIFDCGLNVALADPQARWEDGEVEFLLSLCWVPDEDGVHVPIKEVTGE